MLLLLSIVCALIVFVPIVVAVWFCFISKCRNSADNFKTSKPLHDLASAREVDLQVIPYQACDVNMFNPSIAKDPATSEVIVMARVSSNTPVRQWCKQEHRQLGQVYNSIQGLTEYFDLFADKRLGSGIVMYSTTTKFDTMQSPAIVNPFLTKSNVNKMTICCPGFEDPRLFQFRQEVWCIAYFRGHDFPFATTIDTSTSNHYIIIFPIHDASKCLLLNYPDRLQTEKNWMPFEYSGDLLIVYSVYPHTILRVDVDTGMCTKLYQTNVPKNVPALSFQEKHIGNGAPPQPITLDGQNIYLGAAHIRGVQNNLPVRQTFLYTFEASPPFSIVKIGQPFFIIDASVQIEFVAGMIVDNEAKTVILSFGAGDCVNAFKKYRYEEIAKLLR